MAVVISGRSAVSETDISTLARRLAEQNNVDWRSLEGSGPSGKVVERDVLDYLARVMAGMEDIDSTPEPLPEGLEAWPDQEQPSTVHAVAEPEAASDAVGFDDLPVDEMLSDELLSDDVFLFESDEAAGAPTAAPDEQPAILGSELPSELPDEVDDLLLVEDEADAFADQAAEKAEVGSHAVGYDVEHETDLALGHDVGHGAERDLGPFGEEADEAPPFPSDIFEPAGEDQLPPSPGLKGGAYTQTPAAAHPRGELDDSQSDEWGVEPLAGDPFGFSAEPSEQATDDASLPDLWASDDAQTHAASEAEQFSADPPVTGSGPWLSSGDDSGRETAPLSESFSASEESWHDGGGVAPLDDRPSAAPGSASTGPAVDPMAEVSADEPAPYRFEPVHEEPLEAERLRTEQFAAGDELMASDEAERLDEADAMEDVVALDGAMPEHDVVAAVAALPLVRSGSVLRRHVDVSALAAAQVAVSAELGAEPLEVAPFLLRAVARAAAELEITAGQVALAELRDGLTLRRVDDAHTRTFRSLVEELHEVGSEEDEVGLIAVDLSGLDVDEVVLDVAAPAVTLGRILYDTQHGAYRSTLALSGELPLEKGAKLLNRVAELLDAPVRLVL